MLYAYGVVILMLLCLLYMRINHKTEMSLALMQAAQVEAGKKGGAISAARPEEERKASAQKAAETRSEFK